MDVRTIQHEDQVFRYIPDRAVHFPEAATRTLQRALEQWVKVFPKERTLIQAKYGVPSLFVRFDCVLSESGEVQVYEIQDGCAWVGYAGVANEKFRDVRDTIVRRDWPFLKVLRSDDYSDKDDDLWLERASVQEALTSPHPLIARDRLSDLSESDQEKILGKSLRPLLSHNDKRYGVLLGWWKPVNWESTAHGTKLPWDKAFVLKPQFGFGSKDIMFWNPSERAGRATRTQIERALQTHSTMYLQPFHPPSRIELDGAAYHSICRPYFIFSAKECAYVPAHGVWSARPYPNLRIHGASDSISGPLYMGGV